MHLKSCFKGCLGQSSSSLQFYIRVWLSLDTGLALELGGSFKERAKEHKKNPQSISDLWVNEVISRLKVRKFS